MIDPQFVLEQGDQSSVLKSSPMLRLTFLSELMLNPNKEKNSPKMRAITEISKITTLSKQSLIERKFAQSGHPDSGLKP
jgi:hypothetical protein